MEDEKIPKYELQNKNQEFIKILEPMLATNEMFLYGIKLEHLTYLFPEHNSLQCKNALEDLRKAVALTLQIGQHCLELYKKELSEDSQNHK